MEVRAAFRPGNLSSMTIAKRRSIITALMDKSTIIISLSLSIVKQNKYVINWGRVLLSSAKIMVLFLCLMLISPFDRPNLSPRQTVPFVRRNADPTFAIS